MRSAKFNKFIGFLEREKSYLKILATFSSEFNSRAWNYFHFHFENFLQIQKYWQKRERVLAQFVIGERKIIEGEREGQRGFS
jgi:hypothetical protein